MEWALKVNDVYCVSWQVLHTAFLSTNIYVFASLYYVNGLLFEFFLGGGYYILLPYFSTFR